MDKLSVIADIVGILSFLISIILWIKFDRIANKINQQKSDYIENREIIKSNLLAIRENLLYDGLKDLKIRSKLRTELYSFNFTLNYIIGFKANLKKIKLLKMMKSDLFDSEEACECIDYLIARFDKKEVTHNDNNDK